MAPAAQDSLSSVRPAYALQIPSAAVFICTILYEALLGCAGLTDNLNRSAAEVRTALTKGGVGKVAESGSVLFSFRRQGLVRVGPSHTEDEARD